MIQNIFMVIQEQGNDEAFQPSPVPRPTQSRPGTAAKLNILRLRAMLGQDLWHPDDPVDFHEYSPKAGELLAINKCGRKRTHHSSSVE